MNDKLLDFLESPRTAWDNIYRNIIHPVPISTFVDGQNGKWDLKSMTGPCGGQIESQSNQHRQYWFCSVHENEGTLIYLYFNNSFCWLPPWKEVKK
jgi:hypothetical protein